MGDEFQCPEAGRAPREASTQFLRTSVLCLLNQIRERNGIPTLNFNPSLRDTATAHSNDMVTNGYFSHYGPGGSSPLDRVERSGYLVSATAFVVGENLGWGVGAARGSPLAVVQSWMNSPPHRENILDPSYRDFGVGVARGSPVNRDPAASTYTVDFGERR